MDFETRLNKIKYSIKAGDISDAASMGHEYFDAVKGGSADNDDTLKLLKVFKSNKRFLELASLAERAMRAGATAPLIYTLYAQGLIDQGFVDAGIDLLNARKGLASTDTEKSEFGGLLGRGYKQRFVNAVAQGHKNGDDLRRAIENYSAVYEYDRAWHGANLVALVNRAERDGIDADFGEFSADLAKRVVEDIKSGNGELNFWQIASIAEASLALKDWETVVARYVEFVQHKMTNAFELGSAIRQLREVWQAKSGGEDPVSMILTQVEVKSLSYRKGGSVLTYTPDDSARVLQALGRDKDEEVAKDFGNLEAIQGDNKQTPVHVLEALLGHRDAVCRVVDEKKFRNTTQTGGTGFLVSPGDLLDEIPADMQDDWAQPVLVTNNHVLSDNGRSPSVHIDRAMTVFDNLGEKIPVEKILWCSERKELDVSIAKLDWSNVGKTPDTIPLNTSKVPLDDCSTEESDDKVYIIGHPMGRKLEFSLADNEVVDHDFVTPVDTTPSLQRVHYGAPTEGGNSGSPVLDEDDFEVIAVHRKAVTRPMRKRDDIDPYHANEGVAIRSVKEQLAAE